MANQKYFIRYSKIIQRIKRGDYPSLEVILDYLIENDFEINKRTFNRDINAVLELFDAEILYDRSRKGYFIEQSETDYTSQKLQETLELFSSIKVVGKDKNIISFEKRKSQGVEHLYSILEAIKSSKILKFNHLKYHKQQVTERSVEPYHLKESQGRWYLIAKDVNDGKIKTFGLDRMSLLYCDNRIFSKPIDIDFKTMYKDSFGIVNTNDPKEIEIQVYGANAFFIKSYKLHESQYITEENKDFIRFVFRLNITEDFIMELMKYGSDIEVLAPKSLKKNLLNRYEKAIVRYK